MYIEDIILLLRLRFTKKSSFGTPKSGFFLVPRRNFNLELKKVDHFLFCALGSDRNFYFGTMYRADLILYCVLKFAQKFYFRTTEGEPFLILRLRFSKKSYVEPQRADISYMYIIAL